MVLKVLLKIIKIRDRTIFDPACFRFTAIDNISSYDVIDSVDQLGKRLEHYYYNRDEIKKYSQKRKKYSLKFNIKQMASDSYSHESDAPAT